MPDRAGAAKRTMASTVPEAPAAVPDGDRLARRTYAVLLAVAAAAWAHVLWMALAHDMGGMGGAAAPDLAGGVAYVLAWGVMMAAMMLPSALPMIGLYAVIQRRTTGRGGLPVALFAGVYVAVWTATGVPMYLASLAWSAAPALGQAYATAAILVVAGAFQLTPLKIACLTRCRSPIGFLLAHWHPGWRGGLALGWAHALYCLGCCWALMVVLVAAGAMGLVWVLLIAALVAAEKLLARGEWVARAAGAALVALGVAVAVWPELAAVMRAGGHTM